MAIIICSLTSNSVGGPFLIISMGDPNYFFQLLPEKSNDELQTISIPMKVKL